MFTYLSYLIVEPSSFTCHCLPCTAFLEAGANPDLGNNRGDTPLRAACERGFADAVRLLVTWRNKGGSPVEGTECSRL